MIEKSIVLSDIHFDSADEKHVSLMMKFMRDFKPNTIFLNGDIIDLPSISSYAKNPETTKSFKEDVDRSITFLRQLRKENSKARIIYLSGNHEFRLQSYLIQNAPDLFPFVRLERILGLKELQIEWVAGHTKETWIKYGDLYIGHFDSVKKDAGTTALHVMKEKGVSVLQGHVHRVGLTAKRFLNRTNYGYENPCLASFDVDYVKDPNWQSGATVIYFDDGAHWAYPIIIKDNSFVFEGKKYGI